jgi:hypothetical protein
MAQDYKKFLNLVDLHYGYERRNGHKIALHDERAMDVALQFASDFKPDVLLLTGDILDCAAISHHNSNKPGRTEGMRIMDDAQGLNTNFINPLNHIMGKKQKVWIDGNHEAWLYDLEDAMPGLIGLLQPAQLLNLDGYHVVPEGGHFDLGKLTFVHGNQLSGGEHIAKSAVTSWERSIRFGHHHTYQVYTKTTPVHNKLGKTGIAVPCLCTKDPKYGEGKANRWVQGINYGYVFNDGSYADDVALITTGRMVANGKIYRS